MGEGLSCIAAVAANRVIGDREGGLPWNLPEEHSHFRSLVKEKLLIMGRRNFEISHRDNLQDHILLLSRNKSLQDYKDYPQVKGVFNDVASLVREPLLKEEEAFVLGGAQVYAVLMPYVGTFHLTLIEKSYPGEVKFPYFCHYGWKEAKRVEHPVSHTNPEWWHYHKLLKVPLPLPVN